MPKDISRRVTPTNLVAFHHPSIARGRPIAPGNLLLEGLPPCTTGSKPLTAEIQKVSTSLGAKRLSIALRKQKGLLEEAMLAKCGEVLQHKIPSKSQRDYIEKENRLAGIRFSNGKHTKWFNTYCSGGRMKKPPPQFDDSGLSDKDQAWLKRFERLKWFGEKMEEGPSGSDHGTGNQKWHRKNLLTQFVTTPILPDRWYCSGLLANTPEETPDIYSHTFLLNSQPIYQTWMLTKHKDGTESWSWKETEDDCSDCNKPVAVTLTGDSTLRTDIEGILKLSSFNKKPNTKSARRRRASRKSQTTAADAPAAFQEGRMPASQFHAISLAADDMQRQHGLTWQSSTSQDGDESRGGMRTVSSGSYGPRMTLKADQGNLFNRMTANNELGQAILSRWIDAAPEPIVPSASTFSYPIDYNAMHPQHEDDIFDDGGMYKTIAPMEEPAPTPLQHHIEPTWNDQELDEIFRELNSNGSLDCLNNTGSTPASTFPSQMLLGDTNQQHAPVADQQATHTSFFNLDDLYEQPDLLLDSSISFDSSLSLPLVTPSQSLELLLQDLQQQNHCELGLPPSTTQNNDPLLVLPAGAAHDLNWTNDTTFMPLIRTDETNDTVTLSPSLAKKAHETQRPFALEDLGIDWSAIDLPEGFEEADNTYSPIDFLTDW